MKDEATITKILEKIDQQYTAEIIGYSDTQRCVVHLMSGSGAFRVCDYLGWYPTLEDAKAGARRAAAQRHARYRRSVKYGLACNFGSPNIDGRKV